MLVNSRPFGNSAASRVTVAGAQEQADPFTVKLAGEALLLVKDPVKPTVTDAYGAIVELQDSAVAVTC